MLQTMGSQSRTQLNDQTARTSSHLGKYQGMVIFFPPVRNCFVFTGFGVIEL